jgi:hypothetical protein
MSNRTQKQVMSSLLCEFKLISLNVRRLREEKEEIDFPVYETKEYRYMPIARNS